MQQTVKTLLLAEGIDAVAPLPLSACTVTRPYLLERAGIAMGTVFMFAVPYYTTSCDTAARNISSYAVSRDYHLFFRDLFSRVLPQLQQQFPTHRFAGFSDHSPIAEGEAAVKAGLGSFGQNHLFLTPQHGSFVFLGEIITDCVLPVTARPVTACESCGACLAACPVGLDSTRCLSALTQKKGELTAAEEAEILRHGSAWGCDICQNICPVNRRARSKGTLYSKIPFFNTHAIPTLTYDTVNAMSDGDFAARAYSWRGRTVILRNLALFQQKGEPKK